ncbi:hypothetical protein N665_0593s0008 [Sinapis alba]|nr:hypothetical protein N665_0593s0008 [Sinapis alba]
MLVISYGKYCGIGYFGCPGEKPCDDLDACCMTHDSCVGEKGMTYVDCHRQFKHCVNRLSRSVKRSNGTKVGFSTECPYAQVIPTVYHGMDYGIFFSKIGIKLKDGVLALSVDDDDILCNSRACQERKEKNIVVSIVVATSVIVLLVVLLIIILRRRKREASAGPGPGPIPPSGKRRFTYSEVSSITNNFNKVIGKGGFGIVYLGSLEDGTKIAVMIIKDSLSTTQASKEFQVEAELLLTVHHPNLTSFVGYCDDGRSMALIYEYMANGNLQHYLSSEKAEDLSWEKRLHIAIDSAKGLEYLHHRCRPPIIHRDVKTANILLNNNLEAKIADFGLSKVFPDEDLTHVDTPIDPEYYRTFMLNEKSDVYSFGIVLLELITGKRAIVKTKEGEKISVIHFVEPFLEIGKLDTVVDPQLHGDISSDSACKFVEVAMSCVREIGNNRPAMNQIVSELQQCLADELAREPHRSS